MKQRLGFTLVELLISIAIIGLLTTLVVTNFRTVSPSRELRAQADNLVSFLRQAQAQAFAGQPVNGQVYPYGVRIATCQTPPCSLPMFADENNNFAYDASESVLTPLRLGGSVTVQSVSVDGVTTDPLHVIFRPPSALICLNNSCSGNSTAQIVLGVVGANNTITISIQQSSGRISSS